ncbi:MAG: hypothetical protein IJI61_08935 [Oscillospiraceae bacterium]|nr:hypothetical protein [Oscillospiraceae bacterium]
MARRVSKKTRERVGKAVYTIFLLAFAFVLVCISFIALSDWRSYLVAYERSQPEPVVEAYMAELRETKWKQQVELAIAGMQHPFQTDEECADIINQMLGEKLQYSQAPSTSEDRILYNIYCNGNPVGQFQLERDLSQMNRIHLGLVKILSKSDTFWFIRDERELCPWRVTGDAFDISGFTFTSSLSVTVPETYRVMLNGHPVGQEYVTERNIKYDVLSIYYDEYPNLPTKVKYEVGNIFGTLTPEVYDQYGNPVTIDPEKDDSQFMEPCSAEEIAEMTAFAQAFVEPYARFTGTKSVWGNYGVLKQYVKENSELHKRMDLFIEGGADYMNFYAVNVENLNIDSVYSLGGGFYVINVTYDTTNYAEFKTVQETSTKRIIVCRDEAGILAISVE